MPGFRISKNRCTHRLLAVCVSAALVVLLAACGSSSVHSDEAGTQAPESTSAFISVLRQVSFDHEVHETPQGLASETAMTVNGSIKSVDDGRVFGVGPDRNTEPRFLNATLTVSVDEVLAGDRSLTNEKIIYVEIPRSAETSIKEIREAIPRGQKVLLFLSDYTKVGGSFPEIEPSPVIPKGKTIFAPYADGFLLQDNASGAVVGGFEPLENLPAPWQTDTKDLQTYISAHFDKS